MVFVKNILSEEIMRSNTTLRRVACLFFCVVMMLAVVPDAIVSTSAGAVQRGDVNSDGTVNNTDLAALVRHLSGWDIGADLAAADYDKNGKINNRDAIAMIVDILSRVIDIPALPRVTSEAVGYIAYGETSGLCASADTNDGLTDVTSKYNWGLFTGSGVMSLMGGGGTVVVTGRGMFGTDYTFNKAESPVLITAKYGDIDYCSREVVNAAGTGNGSQKGTFILGDKSVTVTLNGDYIVDDMDMFTRNKTGGATVKVVTDSRVVFGDGLNVTNMQESSKHSANLSPALVVEQGAFAYLFTLGFDHYSGSGTIVVSDALIDSGVITPELFENFYGSIVDARGNTVVIPKLDIENASLREPVVSSDTICYVSHAKTSDLCTSSNDYDGQSDDKSKANWSTLSGSGAMSVVKNGGTVIITGRGMFGVNYKFEKTTTPVLITAVYGGKDYRSHEIVSGTTNGSQKGTFILGDSAVTVSFAGDYILDNVDIFTRNKTGGATLSVLSGANVVFGEGANITNMQSVYADNLNPTLNVAEGGYAYLHAVGFNNYTGSGTIVLDRELVRSGAVAENDFDGFSGKIVYHNGKDAFGTTNVENLIPVELEDGAIYSIKANSYFATADDFGVYDNALVTFAEDTDDMSQLWRAHKNEDGTYSLENMACGSYLCGVSSDDGIEGTSLSVRVSGSADRFKGFRLYSVTGTLGDVAIENTLTGYVCTATENGGVVGMTNESYQVKAEQFFEITKVIDGRGEYPQMLVLSGDHIGSASCPEIIYHNGVYYNYNMTGPITVKTSTDLRHWVVHPDRYAFSERPAWLIDVSEEGAIWAPGCYKMGDRYYLYYCTSSSGSRNSAIGVAVSDDPSKNDWQDLGMVMRSYVYDGIMSGLSSNFNAIDPNVIDDGNGNYYLVYGSYWNGIFMRRLDPKTGMPHETDTNVYNIARGNPNIEAAYIIKRGGYYYQFVAKGSLSAGTYYWAVGRSESITGPYYDKDGVSMMSDGGLRLTEYKDGVVGVAHAQYFEDIDGQGYMVSESWQYRDTDAGNSKIQLHISSVVWTDDGWPVTVLDPDVMGRLGE